MLKRLYKRFLVWALAPVLAEVSQHQSMQDSRIDNATCLVQTLQTQVAVLNSR